MPSALIKTPDKVHVGRSSDSTFDKVWKYYHHKNSCKLSEKEEEIRKRWEYAWSMFVDFKHKANVIAKLTRMFKISDRTAYEDIKNSMRVFGDPMPGHKEAKKALLDEWLLKAMDKAYKIDDLKSLSSLMTRYAKLHGLDAADDNSIADLISKLKPTKIVFTADEDELKKKADELMDGVAQDIEYTDITSNGSEA